MPSHSLSANTLFHYTDSISNLENILINEFRPYYSLENDKELYPTTNPHSKECSGIPMVCFCDIPLSQIKEHIKSYGSYCIGLKKEWGIKKGINPITYYHGNSDYSTALKYLFLRLGKEGGNLFDNDINKADSNNRLRLINFSVFGELLFKVACRSKRYRGTLYKRDKKINDVLFYNEREWRYVPPFSEILQGKAELQISEKVYYDSKIFKKHSKLLYESCRLSFNPSDIKYIILEKNSEILYMAKKLDEIKIKYSRKEIELLKTKIISMEQVIEDF